MEASRRTKRSRAWYIALLIPVVGTVFPSFYSFDAPRVLGFPFFYWYQMVWVLISALITYGVYRATRDELVDSRGTTRGNNH